MIRLFINFSLVHKVLSKLKNIIKKIRPLQK